MGCNTGNGEKLSNSQACCLAQLCLAASKFLSISCVTSYVAALYMHVPNGLMFSLPKCLILERNKLCRIGIRRCSRRAVNFSVWCYGFDPKWGDRWRSPVPLTSSKIWWIICETDGAAFKESERITLTNLKAFHLLSSLRHTVLVLRMTYRKWKETKLQPSMLSGPTVPGSCLVSVHISWPS